MKPFFSQVTRVPYVRKYTLIHRFSTVLAALALTVLPAMAQKAPAKKADAAIKYIPGDAQMVMSINIGQLLKKSGHETFLDLPGMKEAHEDLKQENELAAKFLEKPELLGIDLNQPIHLFGKAIAPEDEFGEPTAWGGIVATPLSAKKFENGLRQLAQAGGDAAAGIAGALLDNIKKEKGFSILAGEGIPAAMGFNDNVIAIIGGDPNVLENAEAALHKALAAKKNLAETEPTFKGYLDGDVDLGGWINVTELMKLSPEVPPEQIDQLTKLIGNLRLAGAVHFDPGAAVLDMFYSTDADFMKKLKPAGKKELVDLIPQNALGSMSYAFDMVNSRKWMKEEYLPALKMIEGGEAIAFAEIALMGALGLNFDNLLDIPKGEFMFTFIDMEMAKDPDFGFEQPKPKLLFGMTVENQAHVKTIIQKIEEQGAIDAMAEAGFGLVQNKDRFYIGSNELLDAAKLGRLPNAIKGANRVVHTGNEMAMTIDFNQIIRIAQDFDAPDEAVAILKKFNQFQVLGNLKKGHYKYEMKLLFGDKKTNGLKQIIDMAQELADQDIFLPDDEEAPQVIEAEEAIEIK